MTRKEAIMILENNRPSCGERIIFKESEVYEAMGMAIDALSAEPCEDAIETQISSSRSHENDLISRQAAIDALIEWYGYEPSDIGAFENIIEKLPSAQPDTSRIENILHGESPEEQYDFIHWLMCTYAMQYTDSREAVIAWLGGAEGR